MRCGEIGVTFCCVGGSIKGTSPLKLKTVEKNHFFVTKQRSQASDMVPAGSVYFVGNRWCGSIGGDVTSLLVDSYGFMTILNSLMAGP